MSENQQDPRITELTEKLASFQKEREEESKKHAEEVENLKNTRNECMEKFEEQGKAFAQERDELHKRFDEERDHMRSEMKKLADVKGVRVNINPKGSYSDSKTRKAKLAAEEAKKSMSKQN